MAKAEVEGKRQYLKEGEHYLVRLAKGNELACVVSLNLKRRRPSKKVVQSEVAHVVNGADGP